MNITCTGTNEAGYRQLARRYALGGSNDVVVSN